MAKLPAISKDLVAATGGPLSAVEQQELQRVMGSLHRSDRVETLSYAFEIALEAGEQKRGPFNVDAAVAALTGGYINLKGNAEQIEAQHRLIQGAAALLKRVCETTDLSLHLSAQERVETLVYAFDQANLAGVTLNGFYADKAIHALRKGDIELDGSPDQIGAKLTLIRAAATLIERATQYEPPFHRPPKAMHYLRSDRYKAEDLERKRAHAEQEERETMFYQKGLADAGGRPSNG